MNDNQEEKEEVQPSPILSLDDDFSLIRSFVGGNEDAFRSLLKRHKEKVRNLIYITIGKPDEVDDIAQEVFITVFRKLDSFRYESQFSTWLYRITINKCRDHIRKNKIRSYFTPLGQDESHEIRENGPGEGSFEIQEIVRKCVAKLPEKYRVPLILRDFDGMNYQEIAETLNTEVGTIKSRIFRAREALKEMLEPMKKDLL
jgi:RNA polymerase sigma-70 factor (ECF subfamily)